MSLVGLVGVIHLGAMPGDPLGGASFDEVLEAALRDATALEAGGIRAMIVENFGSLPFAKGSAGERLAPHQVALMARVADHLRRRFPEVLLAVNCLRNDALSALGIAAACGLDAVRVNVHTGAYISDQGILEGEAATSLRYRHQLGAASQVAIWADVHVKHAQPLAPLPLEDATRDCLDRGLADAVIVTGSATGAPVDVEVLERIGAAAGQATVLIGSGLTPELAGSLAPMVHGAIVGTYLKRDGLVRNPVDVDRVRAMVEACAGRFR